MAEPPRSLSARLPSLIPPSIVAVACWFAAWLDSLLVPGGEGFLHLWSVVGVGLAGMLIFGERVWTGVWVGAMGTAVFKVAQLSSVNPWAVVGAALIISIGKTAAVVGCWQACSRWLAGSKEDVVQLALKNLLERKGVISIYMMSGLLATLPGCILGVLGVCGFSVVPWSDAWTMLRFWWCSDATSILVLTPWLVLVVERPRHLAFRSEASVWERLAAFALLFTVCWVVFVGIDRYLARPFAAVVPLIWIALRLGLRSTAFAIFTLGFFVVWNVGTGSAHSPLHSLGFLSTQALIYLWVMSLTCLTVTANVAAASHAKISLREINETLEAAMAAIPALVFTSVDARSRHVRGNPEALRTLGLSMQTGHISLDGDKNGLHPKPQPDGEIPSPDTLPMCRAAVTGEPVQGAEFDLVLGSGEVRSFYGNAVPLFDQRRTVRGCVSAFVDITERKRTEEKLRLKEAHLEIITSITPVMLTQFDRSERFIFANPAYLELIECQEKQVVGKTLREVIGLDSYALIESYIHEVLQGKRVEFDRVKTGPNGVRRHLTVIYMPTMDSNGEVTGWVGSLNDITDRIRAEEHFRRAVEAAPSGMVLSNAQGRIILVNEQAERLFGYRRDELFGRPIEMLIPGRFRNQHPEKREEFHKAPKDERKVAGRELYGLRKDGTEFPVEIGLSPIHTEEGVVVISSVLDITERKRAEKELQRHGARQDLLAETASRLLHSENPQAIVESLCHKVMDFLGCHVFFNYLVDESSERLQLNACAGIPKEEAERIEWLDYGVAVCGCVARDKTPIIAECIRTTPDERTALVSSHGVRAYACHPLMAQGRLLGTLSFGSRDRDHFAQEEISLMKAVTDLVAIAMQRKLSEETLRVNKQRFKTTFENAPVGVANVALDGRLVQVNQAFAAITGYTKEELAGMSFQQMTHPEDLGKDLDLLDELYHARRNSFSMEKRYFRKDGSIVWVNLTVALLNKADGNPNYYISIIEDITLRREAEESLRRLNEELEQRVAERTIELQHANLNLAQVAEERRLLKNEILEISEREERRIGMQMHEGIGQQIAGIGFLCKVVAGRLGEEGHSQASNANQLVTLLQEAIDSIRDLAKSAYPIELETGGLNAALRGLAERTGKMFNIQCEVKFKEDLPIFHDEAAAVHIYRIVQEALTNIVKHGKARRVSIEHRRTKDGDAICIVDDGVGFNPPQGSPGMGLHLMDYRARLIGAKLTVGKNNGRGCIVMCELMPSAKALLSSLVQC